MYHVNQDRKGTAYTVSVDARDGVTTGISAADRAHTIRLLADPATTSDDLARPGHVFPLRAAEGGVLRRTGHTEAGVDLARLAGLRPAAAVAEVTATDGSMARLPDLVEFCQQHGLTLISIADLVKYRRRTESQVDGGRRGAHPDRPRRVPRRRLPQPARRSRAPRARRRRPRRRAGRARPRALRVPDRRHLRLAALRLRPAARRLHRGGRQGGPGRRPLRARARGPRHRHHAQAAGLPAAGRRGRHARRQPASSACPPTPATTAPARRSSSTSASAPCGCSPTTRRSGPGSRATGSRSSAACRCPSARRRRTCAT